MADARGWGRPLPGRLSETFFLFGARKHNALQARAHTHNSRSPRNEANNDHQRSIGRLSDEPGLRLFNSTCQGSKSCKSPGRATPHAARVAKTSVPHRLNTLDIAIAHPYSTLPPDRGCHVYTLLRRPSWPSPMSFYPMRQTVTPSTGRPMTKGAECLVALVAWTASRPELINQTLLFQVAHYIMRPVIWV
jgi:hypothetical protein